MFSKHLVSGADRPLIAKPPISLGNYTDRSVTERTVFDILTCERASLLNILNLDKRGCKTGHFGFFLSQLKRTVYFDFRKVLIPI